MNRNGFIQLLENEIPIKFHVNKKQFYEFQEITKELKIKWNNGELVEKYNNEYPWIFIGAYRMDNYSIIMAEDSDDIGDVSTQIITLDESFKAGLWSKKQSKHVLKELKLALKLVK